MAGNAHGCFRVIRISVGDSLKRFNQAGSPVIEGDFSYVPSCMDSYDSVLPDYRCACKFCWHIGGYHHARVAKAMVQLMRFS